MARWATLLSPVRKMVKRKNDVVFTEGGGWIYHRASRRKIHFFEHEGVYFLKLKVNDPGLFMDVDPPDDSMDVDPSLGFARPEP